MTQPRITVRSPDGRATAAVEPAAGGRLVSLEIDGQEVIADCERRSDADYFRGSFPLAPWCGMLTDGVVHDGADRHQLPAGDPADGRPFYHGAVHSRTFPVLEDAADRVVMELPIGPDQPEGWPWPGRIRQEYRLTDRELAAVLSVHTDGPEFPAGAGFHPWFTGRLGGDPDRPAEVDFRPGAELFRDDTARRQPGPVGDDVLTGVFADVTTNPRLSWPGGPTLELRANTEVWVTYAQLPCGVCVEPWSTPDGPMDNRYVHRVTPESPCVLEFVIDFRSGEQPSS